MLLSRLKALRLSKKILFFLLIPLAFLSIYTSLLEALNFSQDFPWSPSRLFIDQINPYSVFLSGNTNEEIILTQYPTYAHGTYILLTPLAFLDLNTAKIIWAVINMSIAFYIPLQMNKSLKLNKDKLILVTLFFLCGAPFRNSVANGNLSLFVLLTFSFILMSNKNKGYIYSGLSYLKYNFAPPLVFSLLFQKRFKEISLTIIAPIFLYLIFIAYIGGNPFEVLIQPLMVAKKVIGLEAVGLMSIMKMVFTDLNQLQSVLLYDVLPLFFCLILTWLTVKKIHNEFYIFACLCLASLITITHLYHDFIFLLPALMIGTKFSKNLYSRIIIILVGLNWFGLTLLKFLGYSEAFIVVNYIFYTQLINLMIASLIMLCIFKISKRENLSINN